MEISRLLSSPMRKRDLEDEVLPARKRVDQELRTKPGAVESRLHKTELPDQEGAIDSTEKVDWEYIPHERTMPKFSTCELSTDKVTRQVEDNPEHERQQDTVRCLGMIHDVPCKLANVDPPPSQLNWTDHLLDDHKHVGLVAALAEERCSISLPQGPVIANTKRNLGRALSSVRQKLPFELRAYVLHTTLLETAHATAKEGPVIVHVSINLYADASIVEELGQRLSDEEIFLQDPDWVESSIAYVNPHIMQMEGVSEAEVLLTELELQRKEPQVEPVAWNQALDGMTGNHYSTEMKQSCHNISSSLMKHQVIAYNFMLRRENGDLDDSHRYWQAVAEESAGTIFQHHVTGLECIRQNGPPPEPKGGVLADEMGLAAFTSQRLDCAAYDGHPFVQSKATLIVVPSPLILDNWLSEIKQKLVKDAVHYMVYHRGTRARHYSELLSSDLVLTTYGTVSKEFHRRKARDVLYRLAWHRIVLDEAHLIRTASTKQCEAVLKLTAHHRWCLTGTPISNRVADLGPLVQFCQVPQLDEPSLFSEHILKPSTRSFKDGCLAINKALAPLCLRRTREHLDFPKPVEIHHVIDLNSKERQQYSQIMGYYRDMLDLSVAGRVKQRAPMLQAILRLRIFCDLGMSHRYGNQDHEQEMDPDETWSILQQADQDCCSICSSETPVVDRIQDTAAGTIRPCQHIICRTCIDHYTDSEENAQFMCPACELGMLPSTGSTQSIMPQAQGRSSSTKLSFLVRELEASESTCKSLVLSTWRKTLDATSKLCQDRGIQHVRIDGSVSQADRLLALKRFSEDPSISVLLATFGTGALGVNIVAASHIHIVEPQWNPAIELQAIGRVARIGQLKETTVIRYTTKDTVEEQVRLYQDYKVRLTAAGFGDRSQTSVQAQTRLLTASNIPPRVDLKRAVHGLWTG